MSIWNWFTNHAHYWGVLHEDEGGRRLIQTCYECGKQRECLLDVSWSGGTPGVANQPRVVAAEGKLPYAET
jgi:hypothetical protein